MIPTVIVSARGEQRIRSGHPWVYAADIVEAQAEGGEIVHVVGARRRSLVEMAALDFCGFRLTSNRVRAE